jgi:hypothetical protein
MHVLHAAALGGIVLRNLVPVAGMVLFGWSGLYLLLLYYADTLVSLAAVFTLLFMYGKDMPFDRDDPKQLVGVAFAVLVLTGFFGAVFGMPVLITSMMDDAHLDDQDLRLGLLVQALVGCVMFLTMSGEMRRSTDPERSIRARFGFVTTRWVVVFATAAFIPWAPLMILAYAGASAWLEIRPLPDKPA